MKWIIFFWVVLKSALFSTGGMGPFPSLHSDFLSYGWAGEKQFTEALSIGQMTPGPSGLWVVSLCYLVAGLPAALIACIALVIPPLLIVIVRHFYDRIGGHPATQGLLDGVVLVITGFSIVILTRMFLNNSINVGMVVIAVISAILAVTRRVSTNTILIAALLIGFIFK
jgi:chromate transporter